MNKSQILDVLDRLRTNIYFEQITLKDKEFLDRVIRSIDKNLIDKWGE